MIAIEQNKRDFEYDVHSLTKAFFAGEQVSVLSGTQPEEKITLKISVFYRENEIEICLTDGVGRMLDRSRAALSPGEDRIGMKNTLKRLLYRLLSGFTGKTLPWGNLTGIRPTKIPMALLGEGMSREQIVGYMEKTYQVSRARGELAADIAAREKRLLESLRAKDGYSLYLGIPFCPTICLYCSFSSSPLARWRGRVEDYLGALLREMDAVAEMFQGKKLCTVYMGGGTPTTLESDQLDRVLSHLEEKFDLGSLREFTVEAGRPDTITREKLEVLRRHRVTRISINPQTMNQQTLDLIGRRHTVEQIRESYHLAREMGFDNINMDLIVGLPGEGGEAVRRTMEELGRLEPDSVTVHSLALKRAARLNLMRKEYEDISFTNSSEIMEMTTGMCRAAGLFPYYLYRQKNMAGNFENVGYAKEGKEGLYNILIMEEIHSIPALGAGTVTKRVHESGLIQRCDNVKDIAMYIGRIDEMIERKKALFGG